ncbi:hypothetical protein LR004_01185 [Candidatus Gracilibacteria bacterium]|nr:hypothetical protein [Candidatus Gracilibacteria bacterium]
MFEGRFKSKHIDTDKYLYQCMDYVSYNPLKHKIVDTIEEYKWTSYHQISSNKKITQYRDFELGELEW